MIEQKEQEALIAAATKAVKALGAVPAFEVKLDGDTGKVARVLVQDTAGALTPLYGYASRKMTGWDVHGFGTFFGPEFYTEHQIPSSLHLN